MATYAAGPDVAAAPPLWASGLIHSVSSLQSSLAASFHRLPGSPIILRYIASSYQNDPLRSLLELFLVFFAIRTVLQSRTRGGNSGTNFVKLNDKEIDDLVDDWQPEPLCAPLSSIEQEELLSVPTVVGGASARPRITVATHMGGKETTCTNLASYNFADLAENEQVKERAIATLRKYGVGSCSPPGFYGTIDVHMALEADIARFLGTQSAIIYSQGFSTVSSVIPAFSKRGDIIVADKGVNFAIQKGLQISRSTIKWFEHNDMRSLEDTLESVRRETKRRRGPLTRRFIVTEGLFESDGSICDLAAIVALKHKYKFRLLLDESLSFGTLGKAGRGMTEVTGVPVKEVDMLVGSMANTLGGAGGFCAGSDEVVFHQRINGTAFVFSAALPAMLAVASSTAIAQLVKKPQILERLRENTSVMRSVLDRVQCLAIPSDATSPVIHLQVRSVFERHADVTEAEHVAHLSSSNISVPAPPKGRAALPRDTHDLPTHEQIRLLQAVVDDALLHAVLLTRSKRLPSINAAVLESGPHARPSIRIAVSAAFSPEETREAAIVVAESAVRMLGKRR